MNDDPIREIEVTDAEIAVLPPVRIVLRHGRFDQSSLHLSRAEASDLAEKLVAYLSQPHPHEEHR